MKDALRRLAAYFIDLVVIYFVSALISSVIIANTNYDKFLSTYEDFTNFTNTYVNFFEDFKKSYDDNNLSEKEYNKLIEDYKDIAPTLEEAYSDSKLTKKEYNKIYDQALEDYDSLYIEKNYDLAKMNTVNSVTAIILTIIYFVIIQYFTKGKTIGKKLLKYRVVSNDSNPVSINSLLLRSLIITDVIWASIRLYCLYTLDAYGYNNAAFYLNSIMYMILFVSLLLVIYRKDKRALQDLFAGTKVIEEKE